MAYHYPNHTGMMNTLNGLSSPQYSPHSQNFPAPRDMPMKQQAQQTVYRSQRPLWSWCVVVWSVVSCLLCGSLCGMLSVLFSIFSYVDHKSGDFEASRGKRRWAWFCSIAGIAITVLFFVAVVLMFAVFADELRDLLKDQKLCDKNDSFCKD